jgi:hypothetical protein
MIIPNNGGTRGCRQSTDNIIIPSNGATRGSQQSQQSQTGGGSSGFIQGGFNSIGGVTSTTSIISKE